MSDELLLPQHGNTGRAPANKRKRYGLLRKGYTNAPWNQPGDEKVFLCESVRKMLFELGVKNRHTRKYAQLSYKKMSDDKFCSPVPTGREGLTDLGYPGRGGQRAEGTPK